MLGPGCARCNQLYDNTVQAASELSSGGEIDVTKVSDIHYFAKMGVFMTPGLLIDGEVIATGKLLSTSEIKEQIAKRM